MKTTEQFIAEAKEVWGDRWDYSRSEFTGAKKSTIFICPKHGDFNQIPQGHLLGKVGCKECYKEEARSRAAMTQDEFLQRMRQVWGDRWDLSTVNYVNMRTQVTVVCREHGKFLQLAEDLSKGRIGCKKCRVEEEYIPPQEDVDRFFTEARDVWGDRWDYSKSNFHGYSKKLTIVCHEHGEFSQTATKHLKGQTGCRECFKNEQSERMATTPQEFESKIVAVWGSRWDLSAVNYVNMRTPVTLGCRKHGEFRQLPSALLKGQVGCGKCSGRLKTQDDFIQEAKKVWGDRLDFSKTQYINHTSPVTVICPLHGKFTQQASSVLKGYMGCRKCRPRNNSSDDWAAKVREVWGDRWGLANTEFSGRKNKVTASCREHGEFHQSLGGMLSGKVGCPACHGQKITKEDFIQRATTVWGNANDYSKVEYVNATTPVTVTCAKHGDFVQIPYSHLQGYEGCLSCRSTGTSVGEKEVAEFLRGIGVEAVTKRIKSSSGTTVEIDMLDETRGIGVEFNGIYWHSEKFKENNFHSMKSKVAAEQGIRLLHVWEDEWMFNKDIVKEHLLRVFGKSTQPKIPARKLDIEEIDHTEASYFLNTHHIQGTASATVHVGGYYEEELVALASFKKRKNDYELVRYATSAIVQGGHSKLVSYFEKNYEYDSLITFADTSFSDGGLYRSTGWKEDKEIPPDYKYVVGATRKHKFGYRINRFKNDPTLEYREGLTERELAKLNGLLRVYDAGKIRFIKPHP